MNQSHFQHNLDSDVDEVEVHAEVLPKMSLMDATRLAVAVRSMLAVPNPQCGSPAWALCKICEETAKPGEACDNWISRFFTMKANAYSVKWNIETSMWCCDGHIGFSGQSIAYLAAYCNDQKLDLATCEGKNDPFYPERNDNIDDFYERESRGGSKYFLMPLPGEVVRRTWIVEREDYVILQMLDVRPSKVPGLYEFVVTESGNSVALARSSRPLDPYLLELVVRAEFLPPNASAPFIRDACFWPQLSLNGNIER